MAATTVSVPKYRHHKGSGQAFVQVKGHRHYLGKWDSPKSKERYAAFVAELAVWPTARPPPLPHCPRCRLTVVELCAAYWDFATGYYVKNGQAYRLARPYPPDAAEASAGTYGLTPAAEFGPLRLKAIRQTLVDAGHSRKLHQQAGADHPPHVQVGRGRGDRSRRRLPRPSPRSKGCGRAERTAHETKPVLPWPTRWSTPRCPTCPRWWPIWSASSG